MGGIFISCVSKEFHGDTSPGAASWPGSYRAKLAQFLQACGQHVVHQETFAQGEGDLLAKLEDYIAKECNAVIHLIGQDAGWSPDDDLPEGSVIPSDAVHALLNRHGDTFLAGRPSLRQRLVERGFRGISATQWESYLAIHYNKPLFVFTFADEAERAPTYRTQTALRNDRLSQAEHLELLRLTSFDRTEGIGNVNDIKEAAIAALVRAGILSVLAVPSLSRIEEAKSESKRLNDRFMSVTNIELINREPIPREEAKSIFDAIVSSDSLGVLLVATAGSGKSCILAQVIGRLRDQAITCLAIKLDSVPECSSSKQLGHELGLTESPVTTLTNTAQGQASVLIIDQLDSISTVSGRKTNTWLAFEEVRQEVAAIPGMKLIVACRDFDLQQDHRLRPLGDSKSGFTKVVVNLLMDDQIRKSLVAANLEHFVPTPQQLKILSLPFHLVLFLQGYPELPFHRIGDLYNRYWDRKRADLKSQYGDDSEWYEVIKALSQYMSDHQATYAPKDVVDEWARTAEHMVSIHVLVDTGRDYRFFHESFFDYAFARSFCRTGESLHQFLTRPGEDQQLFRRAQVRQIMGYRRESRREDYLRDLRELLASSQIRFHIKRMVASELHRIPDPNPDEWVIVEPYVLDTDLSPAVSNALRGHEGWFDLLLDAGVWSKWLSSGDAIFINAAIWFLSDSGLHKSRSKAIAELLVPYANAGEDWDLRLKGIMSWGVAHHSLEMTQLYFSMIRRGCFDDGEKRQSGGDFWGSHYGAEKDNPQFIIDLVRCWFVHAVAKYDDGKSWNFLDKAPLNNSGTGCELLSNAVLDDPLYFIEQFLPLFVETVLATTVADRELMRNRAWPYLNNAGDPHDLNDSIFQQVRQVLERFAKNDISLFRQLVEPLKQYRHETFGYLLLMSYAANPAEFADECIEYMCAHQPRINIGYGVWSGGGHGESAVSREAIRAITPFCSKEMMNKLEDAVIGYADSYERENPGRRGFGELLVLRSIDSRARSDRVKVRISELECGFPNISDDLPPRDDQSMATWIGSPIPDDKASLMTDDQWLSAMKTYDGTTDRFKGGPVELSRVLTAKTRENRVRFAKLAMRMLDNVEPIYFSAILEGLCGSNDLPAEEKEADKKAMDSTPLELIENVIRRVHSIPNSSCGSAIAHAIEKLADRELSSEVLRILSFYATNDPDPDSDIWQDKTRNYYGGDPFTHGINSVRGRAAIALGALLYAEQSRFSTLRPAIEALANDPVISVRTCAISAIMPVLNFERDTAVQLFVGCCQDAEAIWATTPFDRFVHFAIHSHYSAIRNLLQSALQSENEEAVRAVATRIVLADLSKVELGDDVLSIQTGNEWMRKAACHVYAHNIGHPEVGDRCAEVLQRYFNDNSEEVRKQIGHAFWKTDGDRLLQLESMISRFIESPSFESGAEELLRALAKSTVELPKVACRAAERVIDIIGNNGGDNRLRKMGIANSLSTLIVRQYAQSEDTVLKRHCLDLIDQMERLGFLGISEELSKIDR